ncbi:hypothetical protein BGZ46_001456 [Entomortierella lignicola]|nr:hypothetical protein BGZ46_001456 [Entomortierella lignicola]
MKGFLALVLTISLASRLPTITATINQPQDQGVLGGNQELGSIEDLYDPMGISDIKNRFVARVSKKKKDKLVVPAPFKDNQTVFSRSHYEFSEFDAANPILQPFSTASPSGKFNRENHVMKPVHIRTNENTKAIPTNKFYGNLVLGDSHAPVWTQPYGLRWDSMGPAQQGLGISQIDDNMKAFGPTEQIPTNTGDNSAHQERARFYINPFLVSMGISATEFDARHDMTVGNFGEFGCTMLLVPFEEADRGKLDTPRASIRIPIVRGMAFITALYDNLTPQIFSNVLVRTLTLDPKPLPDGWVKYRFLIENGVTWLLYAKADRPGSPPLVLSMVDQSRVIATSGTFTGLVQIAKLPVGGEADAENIYDQSVGVYATSGDLVVEPNYLDNTVAGYRIDWNLAGNTKQSFLHFTLAHHRDSITDTSTPTSLVLPSTAKGKMVAYRGASWHLYEPERLTVGLLPDGWASAVSPDQLAKIRAQAAIDAEIDFDSKTNVDSMYFAGKGLAKFALLNLIVTDVLKDNGDLKKKCLDKLKFAFSRFLDNRQQFPLVYDLTWKGVISSQGLTVGPLADFGNSWYNDHHFHYGYFVHTAAIIRHLDPTWRKKDVDTFTNNLLRDVANPSEQDKYFPTFRAFDWFTGHSWSQGLFVSLDGKDEESTSEDINFYYAMSLWGQVTNNVQTQKLGQLMLTVARRSIQTYFLMEDDNKNHPDIFVGNKVPGILFENKADHATYFSPRLECIQGIQMIPATPALTKVRRYTFVKQEWETLLAPIIDSIDDGWKSILMMNYAMLNKDEAWKYFSGDAGSIPLDDGMTLTWAMFHVASQQRNIG